LILHVAHRQEDLPGFVFHAQSRAGNSSVFCLCAAIPDETIGLLRFVTLAQAQSDSVLKVLTANSALM